MITISDLTRWVSGRVANEANLSDAAKKILTVSTGLSGMAPLGEAKSGQVAFFFSKHYQSDLLKTQASVIITGNDFVEPLAASGLPQWRESIFIACQNPYLGMALVSQEFSKTHSSHDHQERASESKIHPTAVIDPTVSLGQGVTVGAYAVIEKDCNIRDGATIYPHCHLSPGCIVGEGTVLFARVTLYENTLIGKRCRIHSGAVIGADGFGYVPIMDSQSGLPIDHQKIYHCGNVIIEDDVEIGANSTVDRGTLGSTRIRSKVKIDNLVQIGHNSDLGDGSVLCGMAGMAGSSSTGKFVVVGARGGASNQVHLGDYSKVGGYTGVAKDIGPGEEVAGVPARPLSEHYKILAMQNKMLRSRNRKKQ